MRIKLYGFAALCLMIAAGALRGQDGSFEHFYPTGPQAAGSGQVAAASHSATTTNTEAAVQAVLKGKKISEIQSILDKEKEALKKANLEYWRPFIKELREIKKQRIAEEN